HLHEIDAAAYARCGKAGEIADNAAAEGHGEIAAFDAGGDDLLAHALERRHLLRALARRDEDARGADAGLTERRLRRSEMMRGDVLVADDDRARTGAQLPDRGAERREHAAADDDVVGALAERDRHGDRLARLERRGHDAFSSSAARCAGIAAMISSTMMSC